MSALGTSASGPHGRYLHLIGLGLALLFLASVGAVWATPVQAKDWTPQIKATRHSQIYWESVMRAADHDVRGLQKARKQTQRKLKKAHRNLAKAAVRRTATKRRLTETRALLRDRRALLATATMPPPPPPDAATAILALSEAVPTTASTAQALADTDVDMGLMSRPDPLVPATEAIRDVSVGDVVRLEKQARQQKRTFKKARRKARRISANVRVQRNRLAGLKSARRNAIARRESAERNLGAYIIAMARLGKNRAARKRDVRPGLNSPFSWPARGRVSQGYSASHDGLDIVSYRGAPIRAAAYGVVSYVGWNPWDEHGRAFMVVVAHGSGYETLYGHCLPSRNVRIGQEVNKGQIIAYMGNTGYSTGTHLHFELRRGRTTVNPLGFL
jgi:murein DD-endopeptidase MepM/ murein hydrolase activator NlpD